MLGKKGNGANQFTYAKKHGLPMPTPWNKGTINFKGHPHTEETKEKLSKIAFERGLGGHTSKKKIFFQKKSGEVIYLQSSYEIRFAEILERLDITWVRPSPLHWICAEGKPHRYYPDFKVGEVYIDTKNSYLAVKDLPKIELVRSQNQVDIRIVTEENITEEYILAL